MSNNYNGYDDEDDFFDDDFQVIYDDDDYGLPKRSSEMDKTRVIRRGSDDSDHTRIISNQERDSINRAARVNRNASNSSSNSRSRENARPRETSRSRETTRPRDNYRDRDSYYDDDDRSSYAEAKPDRKRSSSKGSAKSNNGGKIFRVVTLLIIAYIIYILAKGFMGHSSSYGDIATAIADVNVTLGAYLAIAAFFLIFEIVAFFRAMSSRKVKSGVRSYRIDTGRGLGSFIFLFICSYLAYQFVNKIPSDPAFLTGIQGALNVLGSNHQVFLFLCAAGVISCVLRRQFAR